MTTAMLSDATPVFLLSPWKPFLMCAIFIPWAWVISTHLEKDAKAVHLNHTMWNGIHVSAGIGALVLILFGRYFFITFPIAIVIMIAPMLLYWKVRNEEVSEEKQFHIGSETVKAALDKRKKSKASRQVTLKFLGKNGAVDIPDKDDPQIEVYLATDELITEALHVRASRLEFQLTAKGFQAAFLIDGILTKRDPLPSDLGAKVVAFLKEAAGADPTDVRRMQLGEFDVESGSGKVHVNLTASGSSKVHVIRLDFDREQRVMRTWETTGLLPAQRELLNQLKQEKRRNGIVLIGGEKQSGVTTTSYAILSQHDSYLCNIVTVEREVIGTLEGITHNSCVKDESLYASKLQTVIRRDPEIVLAADLRDAEAAKIAAKPGYDGPLIYVSMSASSTSELVSKWAGLVGDPRKSFGALRAVVFQKLVRRLCENCRVPYKPGSDLAKQGMNLDSVEQLYRKGGQVEQKNKVITCPICNGSGYMGQVGVYETMFLDNDTRKHLIAGDLKAAMAHARRNKQLIRLQDAALQQVAAGETTLEEFGRVGSKKVKTTKQTPATTK